jgi:hypothetical protein
MIDLSVMFAECVITLLMKLPAFLVDLVLKPGNETCTS